jgi:hypothetical protein
MPAATQAIHKMELKFVSLQEFVALQQIHAMTRHAVTSIPFSPAAQPTNVFIKHVLMMLAIHGQPIAQQTHVVFMALASIAIVTLRTISTEATLMSATLILVTWSSAPMETALPLPTVLCCTRPATTSSANQSHAHLTPNVLQKRMDQVLPDSATPQLKPASNVSVPTLSVKTHHRLEY